MAQLRRLFSLFCLFSMGLALHAQTTFSNVVVFGDSLSDTGNVAHVTQTAFGVRYPGDNVALGFDYTDGRFTDGKDSQPAAAAYFGVWAEQLALSFPAKVVLKNSLDGGTDYAYGDATTQDGTTTLSATIGGQTVGITINNMGQQVTDYLATNPTPNAQTLYIVWGGANDLYADDSAAGVQAAVQRELALIQRLIHAGGSNFMVPNLPPLGGVPDYAGGGSSTALNVAAASFAAQLAQGLAGLKISAAAQNTPINVYPVDVFSLFAKVVSNPMALGFGNISAAAQNVSGSPDSYLIWDGLHPTTTGHHYIAAAAANLLTPLVSSAVSLSLPPAVLAGQAETLQATVTSGSAVPPSGLVTFFSGGSVLGTAVVGSNGVASTTFPGGTVAASPYSVTAVYAGNTAQSPSTSAAGSFTVLSTPVATTTTVMSSSLSANFAAPVTFTASVTAGVGTYGAPTGTVTFFDGGSKLGTATATNGSATYTTSALTSGSHSITASYAASGVFAASPVSAAITEVIATPAVTAVATPTQLTISSGSSGTATITATGTGGFSGTLGLACGSLPAHFSCSFSTSTLTLTSASPTASSTLTIATNAASALALPAHPASVSAPRSFAAALFLPALAGLLLTGFGRGKTRRGITGRGVRLMLLLLLFSSALLGVTGCGSGANTTATPGNDVVNVILTNAGGPGTSVSFVVVVQ